MLASKKCDCCDAYAEENQRFHDEIERLRSVLSGVEIALARDENIDGAMKLIVAAKAK